jgi:hypothetical protein
VEQLHQVPGRILEEICLPPGPVTMSFRKGTPSARRRSTSASMSFTTNSTRFQPPGPGFAPSGIGPPRGAGRPAEQQAQVATEHVGERRCRVCSYSEAEMLRVELHGGIDVMNQVPHVDGAFWHVTLTSRRGRSDERAASLVDVIVRSGVPPTLRYPADAAADPRPRGTPRLAIMTSPPTCTYSVRSRVGTRQNG